MPPLLDGFVFPAPPITYDDRKEEAAVIDHDSIDVLLMPIIEWL